MRGASSSLYTADYYAYTGIDPKTGVPTGLTQGWHRILNAEDASDNSGNALLDLNDSGEQDSKG